MAKGDLKHKKPLRSWLKPKCGEAQRSDFSGVYGVDYQTAINAIAGEAIRMPREKSNWSFTLLHLAHHLVKHFSPRLLCAFAFNKSFGNFNVFPLGKFRQLRELGFNAHHLAFLVLGRFSCVEKVFCHILLLVAFGGKARD
ncbi:MAG: hypothetical protein A2782_02600 [Candidatus Blackburnbacteria bacterium RIFCSPHIGHO2_01_FULL_43_15b]|uniref:Uncharacterized protein n=1 Tax=Candidatus Blackburnbacteria bacterium RIFCSPHIGHO2_01_FULL_43_15b TaxID=1797513 RepID=A0A1G1V1X3_9BACT|nr:MAG: hypothetical protein A2782_02600 [Candidatus Blackburnbacteria bacterium RIFCSPHIGHO2_01_FULL_43_15b]